MSVVIGDVEALDHENGLVEIVEVTSRHLRLDLAEELQELASHRQEQAELNLLSQHPGDGLRVDQVVAVVRKVLGRLLEPVAVPGSAWMVDDLVAVLVQHLRQAAWRAPVNPGAVGQEGGHHGEPVTRQHHSAAGGEGDSPDLDGVAVEEDLEHGEVLYDAEGGQDVVHPIVAVQMSGCFFLCQPGLKWIRLLQGRRGWRRI